MKTELKNRICNRFYGISFEGPVLMERVLKNADISILSNFQAIFYKFFSAEKFYQALSTWQISNQLDHPNRNYRGGRICPPPAICKKPGLFRINSSSVQTKLKRYFKH